MACSIHSWLSESGYSNRANDLCPQCGHRIPSAANDRIPHILVLRCCAAAAPTRRFTGAAISHFEPWRQTRSRVLQVSTRGSPGGQSPIDDDFRAQASAIISSVESESSVAPKTCPPNAHRHREGASIEPPDFGRHARFEPDPVSCVATPQNPHRGVWSAFPLILGCVFSLGAFESLAAKLRGDNLFRCLFGLASDVQYDGIGRRYDRCTGKDCRCKYSH